MKQLSLIFTLLTALIVATNTHAHTGLESSVPSNNTMLMESLEEIELHFASEVNLIKLELVDRANGESVSLGFQPAATCTEDRYLPGQLGGDGRGWPQNGRGFQLYDACGI